MKKIALDKRLIRIIIILPLLFNIYRCAKYRFEQYSANESKMTCYRGKLLEEKAQVSLAINGKEKRFHIPFIWRKLKVQSPYKIEIAITTQSLIYKYVLVHSVKLIKESGEVVYFQDKNDTIKLDFILKDYSVFALGKAYQAHYYFPKKVDIDYVKNKNITVVVDISLVSKERAIQKKIEAQFYAFFEKGVMSIISTYSN